MAKRENREARLPAATPADLAFELWKLKKGRQSKGVKDYQTYGLNADEKRPARRRRAMDYVSPGDGGW